ETQDASVVAAGAGSVPHQVRRGEVVAAGAGSVPHQVRRGEVVAGGRVWSMAGGGEGGRAGAVRCERAEPSGIRPRWRRLRVSTTKAPLHGERRLSSGRPRPGSNRRPPP